MRTENAIKKSDRQTRIGSKVFNARLFFEGVKRLRVLALAVCILAFAASVLIPVISWINYADRYESSCWIEMPVFDEEGYLIDYEIEYVEQEIIPDKVETYLLCLPLYVLPFVAPLFFFVLFSFLHKRKESDFYHAIPYTRTCVYVSFTLSALAVVAAIALLSALLSGVLYAVCPFTTYAFGDLVALIGNSFLSAAFLSSFMMLALSLTGTAPTTLILFALFAAFTRVVLAFFALAIDNLTIVSSDFYPYLSIYWYLPLRMFVQTDDYYSGYALPSYGQLIPYTIIVTLALFAAAGLFYKLRRSEMAERSAPSKILQSVFRCLFTLPFALLLATMILVDEIDFEVTLLLLAIILVAFYLYELITTRRARNLPRATPWLGVVAGGAVVFVIVFALFSTAVHAKIPEEKIASVTVETSNDTSFESLSTASFETSDERMISLVSEALTETIGSAKNNNYRVFSSYYTVRIRKTSGAVVLRRIGFTPTNETKLETYLVESEEYSEKYLELPPADSITSLYAYTEGSSYYYDIGIDDEDHEAFWEILSREYEALSFTDKMYFKAGSSYVKYYDEDFVYSSSSSYGYSYEEDIEVETKPSIGYETEGDVLEYDGTRFCIILSVSGRYHGNRYYSSYAIPASMRETIAFLVGSMEEHRTCRYRSKYLYENYGIEYLTTSDTSLTPADVTRALFRDLASGEPIFREGYVSLALYGEDSDLSLIVSKTDSFYPECFTLLSEYAKTKTESRAGTTPVFISADLWDYESDYTSEAYTSIILYLTDEEYTAIIQSLHPIEE